MKPNVKKTTVSVLRSFLASFAILFIVSVTGIAASAQGTWKVDKAHSKLTFTVTHLGISDVLGLFKDFDVTITASKADFSDAVFEMTAKTASVNTEVEKRDAHLKSPDFFDAEKYPELSFKSTGIRKTGENRYALSGNLTLNGVTKPVTMELWYRGTIENQMSKKPVAGFQLTGTLKRSDFNFGSKFNPPMLSNEVSIRADGEFSPAK